MAIKDTDLIKVRNRNNGVTGYTLPDNNLTRNFNIGETKPIPFSELKSLQYVPGGQYILDNLLVIENEDALKELNMTVEPEYFYNEAKIRELLFSGSYDAFADFLDFAPTGAIEMAKEIAVKEEIPDMKKRNMLSKKTGLNINNAIMVNKVMDEDEESTEEKAPKQRRVQIEEPKQEVPQRRTAASKYNVVSK